MGVPGSQLGLAAGLLVLLAGVALIGLAVAFYWWFLAWVAGPAIRRIGRSFAQGWMQATGGSKPSGPLRQSGEYFANHSRSEVLEPPQLFPKILTSNSELPTTRNERTSSDASAGEESAQRAPLVYSYSAPGMPLCPICGQRPALFYCSRHNQAVCLQCVGSHDRAGECFYVPNWRGGKVDAEQKPTGSSMKPARKPKPGDVFGIS